MNFDRAISLLSHSSWGFLALWIVLLGAAFGACFSENVAYITERRHSKRSHQ
jgi:hypothetical protein